MVHEENKLHTQVLERHLLNGLFEMSLCTSLLFTSKQQFFFLAEQKKSPKKMNLFHAHNRIMRLFEVNLANGR